MFFVGIFGINQKEKKVGVLEDLDCKCCNGKGNCHLIKNYNYFHIFFIPVFKWNENYYVVCEECNKVFSVSKEKGKRVENGEKNVISYWDLKDVGYVYGVRRCSSCNREIDSDFQYCPYCGNPLD